LSEKTSSETTSGNLAKLGLLSATLLVVANIIGSGIFVTPGEIVRDMPSAPGLLLVFAVGGLLSLFGALAYGELAAAMPRSGGEYHYLSVLYHPLVGFLSGFVSLVAGFSAPIALSATGFGYYMSEIVPILGGYKGEYALGPFTFHLNDPVVYASVLVVLLTGLHSLHISHGVRVQNLFTLLKVSLIALFILAGLFVAEPVVTDWSLGEDSTKLLFGSPFALGLISVYFAYSGWNAAAYLSSEIKDPARNVPRALLLGTLVVIVLYLLLNYVFLHTVSLNEMSGTVTVGKLAANNIFGTLGGNFVTMLISLALVSSVSSMVMAGPRITAAMGEDFPFFARLGKSNLKGVPANALLLQMAIALFIIFTASFFSILIFVGFMLSFFAMLAVAGVFLLRINKAKYTYSYRTAGYPLTPALFVGLCLWIIYNSVSSNPDTLIAGLATLAVGVLLYVIANRKR
jgi:basic amino acid/polyamine antiporter, APA family